jgi:hypothetical protein
MANGDFCFALIALCLMSYALRFQTQPRYRQAASKGCNGWRVDTD